MKEFVTRKFIWRKLEKLVNKRLEKLVFRKWKLKLMNKRKRLKKKLKKLKKKLKKLKYKRNKLKYKSKKFAYRRGNFIFKRRNRHRTWIIHKSQHWSKPLEPNIPKTLNPCKSPTPIWTTQPNLYINNYTPQPYPNKSHNFNNNYNNCNKP